MDKAMMLLRGGGTSPEAALASRLGAGWGSDEARRGPGRRVAAPTDDSVWVTPRLGRLSERDVIAAIKGREPSIRVGTPDELDLISRRIAARCRL